MSRKERLKVYHGLPKSIVDSNTVFYMSCDSLNPEINCLSSSKVGSSSTVYGTSCTGGSLKFIDLNYLLCTLNTSKVLTIDFILNMPSTTVSNATILRLSKSDTEYFSVGFGLDNTFHCDFTTPDLGTKFNWISNVSTVFKLGINHIRICFSNSDVLFYINGIYYSNEAVGSYPSVIKNDLLPNINALRLYFAYPTSDLHISNINRGDFFPNLPQDFIDGKAIIKPRMGQQQIKGDPLYSQETVDIVKIGTNANEPQIICSRTTGNWTNGDTIKVKGISGEIISGIIDTNTALARLTEPVTTSLKFKVDSVDKLSVGDKIRFISKVGSGWVDSSSWSERTISNIDAETKTVTVSSSELTFSSDQIALGAYVVETTTTTSSPIVKTSDGTVITGNWSNLGTNEATFTLGTNATLINQDLYITYSLNIAPGNSDFTQLPYSIEKVYDELGNELEKVSEIVIEDDFKGKVALSVLECPHKLYTHLGSTLKNPSNITGNFSTGFEEIATDINYNLISYLDSNSRSTTGGTTTRPQHLVTFNVLEMVERKMGEIPALDKIEWLKSNISNITLNYNVGSTSNVYVQAFISNAWNGSNTHIGGVQPGTLSISQISNCIQSDGCVHFLVFGELNSTTIYIDYLKLSVKLVVDSQYKTYFVANTRARECPCTPILIQKETKTLKRYFSNNKYFVTEVLYSDPKPTNDIKNTTLIQPTFYYATTMGTGTYNKGLDYYRECLAKLGFDTQSYRFNNSLMQSSTENKTSDIKIIRDVTQSFTSDINWSIPTKIETPENCMYLIPSLVNINNEINMKLVYREISQLGATSNKGTKIYKIPNRPLIK